MRAGGVIATCLLLAEMFETGAGSVRMLAGVALYLRAQVRPGRTHSSGTRRVVHIIVRCSCWPIGSACARLSRTHTFSQQFLGDMIALPCLAWAFVCEATPSLGIPMCEVQCVFQCWIALVMWIRAAGAALECNIQVCAFFVGVSLSFGHRCMSERSQSCCCCRMVWQRRRARVSCHRGDRAGGGNQQYNGQGPTAQLPQQGLDFVAWARGPRSSRAVGGSGKNCRIQDGVAYDSGEVPMSLGWTSIAVVAW